jgi:O-antigen/teichoic acid export membrane protein
MTAAAADAYVVRRSLPRNAALALFADIAAKASQLVVMLVAARLLSVGQMAVLGVCLACATLLTSVLDAGVSLVISRDGAAGGDAAELAGVTLRSRVPYAALAAVVAVMLGVATGQLAAALSCLVLAALGAAALSVLAVFRAQQDLTVEARYKLAAGVVSVLAALALMMATRTAAGAVAGLAVGPLLLLPRLMLRHVAGARNDEVSGPAVLRHALPFGAIAIATLAYYRLPTLVLGSAATSPVVARYTIASTLGFGALAAGNAITTGLLPKLAATDEHERSQLSAKALEWAVRVSVALAVFILFPGRAGLGAALGSRYESTYTPLAILLAASAVVAASGVLGTALTAAGRSGALMRQVAWTLVANLVAVLVLAPRFGADGAAVATLLTEALALVLLARSTVGLVAPISTARVLAWAGAVSLVAASGVLTGPARLGACACAVALTATDVTAIPRSLRLTLAGCTVFAFEAYAIATNYGMRVISDTPTYLAIVPKLAATPFHPISVFMRAPSVDDPHATPYLQGVALLYRLWDADARPNPIGVARMLAIVGLFVAVFVLHAFYVWARSYAGPRAALLAVPLLLVLFGPAHVIWAGDLTFHGFMYGGYFPQTLAIGLMLWTLLAVDGPPVVWRYLASTVCVASTFVVHPFTGTLLSVLVATGGCVVAVRDSERWQVGSFSLIAGYLIAARWPGYSLGRAVGDSGIPAVVLIGGCATAPLFAAGTAGTWQGVGERTRRLVERFASAGGVLAPAGFAIVLVLAGWESWLFTRPNPDPLVHSNHLSLYWVEDRWRWPLMYAAGAVGLAGLCRLALRGRILPLLFASGCLAAGTAGALGLSFPLWWRFVLFAQAPLALGSAEWITTASRGAARRIAASTFAFNAVFKVGTLLLLPTTITYFGSPLQDSYRLGSIVPAPPGVVAADPFTSYFIPGATGHEVLVVTKAHVGSSSELAAANDGYALLHRFYMGSDWWTAAQEMYRRGVRYVVIEKSTSLRAPDLVTFSTGPTPLVRTDADRRALGTYYYRNNRVGKLVYDARPYTVYQLSPRKLFGR